MDSAAVTPRQHDHSRSGWTGRGGPLALVGPGLAGFVGIGALVVLHLRDPHVEGSYGWCPVWYFLGIYCPGCGGLRSVHDLTEGHVLDSLHSNLLVLPLVILGAWFVLDWGVRAWQGKPLRMVSFGYPTMWALLAFLVVFGVLRNTPWGTWLTPV